MNAISSLRLGIEDYDTSIIDDERRTSSVRNIFASLLLFLKEGLCLYSPTEDRELLIKSKILPKRDHAGSLQFVGQGKNTVDVQEIQERYRSLGIAIDWQPLEEIKKIRNNMEHYYSQTAKETVQAVICDAATFIVEILKKVLKEDPASLLGNTWLKMNEIKDIYGQMKKDCDETLDIIYTKNIISADLLSFLKQYSCPSCDSMLIHLKSEIQDDGTNKIVDFDSGENCTLVCFSCHTEIPFYEPLELYIYETFGLSTHDIAHGEMQVIHECPGCGHNTFIEDGENDSCLLCGYEKEWENCSICGDSLSTEEQELGGLCFNCDYNLHKYDD
jgi:predicted RNA-binding Zn-ribbon protein involved in translation (DUF1610 family)